MQTSPQVVPNRKKRHKPDNEQERTSRIPSNFRDGPSRMFRKWDQIMESVPRLILLDQEGTWWTPYSNKGGYGYERRNSRRLDSKKAVNLNGEEKDPELDSRAIMTSTQDGMNNPSSSLMSLP